MCFRWRFNVSRLAVVSVGPAGRVSDNNRTLVCFGRRTPRQRDDHRRRTEMLQPSLFLLPLLHRLLLLLDSSLSLSLSPLALERPSNNTTLPGSFVGTTRSVAAIHWSREGRRGIGSVRTNIFPPLKTPIRCQRVVLASSFLLLFLLFIYFFLFHFPSFPPPPPVHCFGSLFIGGFKGGSTCSKLKHAASTSQEQRSSQMLTTLLFSSNDMKSLGSWWYASCSHQKDC